MTQPVGEIINLKDKLKALLTSSTVDQAYTMASSILLTAAIIKIFMLLLTPNTTIDYVILIFMFGGAGYCTLVAYGFRTYDQKNRTCEAERILKTKKENYLLDHRHLEKMDITLDDVPNILARIERLQALFENITLNLAEAIRTKAMNNGDTLVKKVMKEMEEEE